MRAAACLLIVSLVSPAVVSAACELACLHELHHAAGAAYAGDCHEDGAGDTNTVTVSGAGGALCHDDGEGPIMLAAAKTPDAFAPAAMAIAHVAVPDAPGALHVPRSARARPPDLLLITTQLRI